MLAARSSKERREDYFVHYLGQMRDNARQRAGTIADLAQRISGAWQDVGDGGVPEDVADEWKVIDRYTERAISDLENTAYELGEIADKATEILVRRRLGTKGDQ